jgi:acetoacetyl-CoA synthetase
MFTSEAVVLVLATSSLGAIWTSSPPEFGLTAILERFHQVNKVMCAF